MRTQRVVLGIVTLAAGVGVLSAVAVSAHHAFGAEYDATKPIKIQGILVEVEWINPHAWFHVEVKTPDGKVERWMFEAGNPGALTRRGFTKHDLELGTEIVVEGYLSKGVPYRANGRVMTYTDGRTLFVGSSGTGAPLDGADAAEKR